MISCDAQHQGIGGLGQCCNVPSPCTHISPLIPSILLSSSTLPSEFASFLQCEMILLCWCAGAATGMRKSLSSLSSFSMAISLAYTAFLRKLLNGNRYVGMPFASRVQNLHSNSISVSWVHPRDEQRFLPAFSFCETCERAQVPFQAQRLRTGGTLAITNAAAARTMWYRPWLYS